jgi:predicted nucleic acid-binding protein
MATEVRIAIDSSVLVALLNPDDVWRDQALMLRVALHGINAELFYFDAVAAEAVSVASRRLREKTRSSEVPALLDRLNTEAPIESITWIFPEISRLYPAILDLIRSSSGSRNFNDALIALACQDRGIPFIASFDADFDQVAWLQRVSTPDQVRPTSSPAAPENQDQARQ